MWHSLIAGARGIIYFQHNFTGPCVTHHALRGECSNLQPQVNMVTSVNAQIKSLAPVLNSPFVISGHSASSSIEHMVKWNGSNFYVFAGARTGGNATISMPCVGNATATVIGENRTRAGDERLALGFFRGRERRPHLPRRRRLDLRPELVLAPDRGTRPGAHVPPAAGRARW